LLTVQHYSVSATV